MATRTPDNKRGSARRSPRDHTQRSTCSGAVTVSRRGRRRVKLPVVLARVRPLVVVAVAALVGALMSWATAQGRTSVTTASSVRDAIGSLSTPWLVIPFLAGATRPQFRSGVLLGLASTIAALTGWYVYAAATQDLGGASLAIDLRLEFAANRLWFLLGLLSGPVFGGIGAWWRSSCRLSAGVVVAALLIGEPLLMAALTLLHNGGVLSPERPLPSVLSFISHTWVSQSLTSYVLLAEFVLGVLVLLAVLRLRQRRGAARPGGRAARGGGGAPGPPRGGGAPA